MRLYWFESNITTYKQVDGEWVEILEPNYDWQHIFAQRRKIEKIIVRTKPYNLGEISFEPVELIAIWNPNGTSLIEVS